MKRIKAIMAAVCLLAALLFTGSCATGRTSGQGCKVGYTVAKRYFLNNGQQLPTSGKVTDADTFGRLFGMATVMGPSGRPTQIDFSREFVIPVTLPATDRATAIKLGRLTCDGQTLILHYQVTEGRRMSYTIQPLELVIVDGRYRDCEVRLAESR